MMNETTTTTERGLTNSASKVSVKRTTCHRYVVTDVGWPSNRGHKPKASVFDGPLLFDQHIAL